MIRVVIADDSAFMRKVLSDLFASQPDFEVVAQAANGKEAVDDVRRLKPDLLTLDVNMPVMDGLKALETIMNDCPLPVVMFSSLTQKGTDATINALSLGAVDFISKAGGSVSRIDQISGEILSKCRAAAGANVRHKAPGASAKPKTGPRPGETRTVAMPKREGLKLPGTPPPTSPSPAPPQPLATSPPTQPSPKPVTYGIKRDNPLLKPRPRTTLTPKAVPAGVSSSGSNGRGKLVAIGTSTGGPKALQSVIPKLPANLPCGVVIVQHMPAGFTKSLAERLDSMSAVSVKEAENDEIIKPGYVYIAPGNYHMKIVSNGPEHKIVLDQTPPVGNHRPAVNVLFDSTAALGKNLVSVIMTGMGCDGCEGAKKIRKHGGYIIAENENTSIVYGMPKAVVEAGLADEVLPVYDIAKAIVDAVRK